MRFFYLIIFLYCSNIGFGQDEVPSCSMGLPNLVDGYFPFYKFNHFEELLPSEKLKELGIKTIIIQEPDKDKIPTISVDKDCIRSLYLNENGKVRTSTESFGATTYYKWNKNKIMEIKDISDYYTDVPDTTIHTYNYSNKEINIIIKSTESWQDERDETSYFNDEGRVEKEVFLKENEFVEQFKINYEDENRLAIIEYQSNNERNITDSLYFNDNKKPFMSVITLDNEDEFNPKFIQEVVYAYVNIGQEQRIIKYVSTSYSYRHSHDNPKPKLKKDESVYNFDYDKNGLLIKITFFSNNKKVTQYEVSYLKN